MSTNNNRSFNAGATPIAQQDFQTIQPPAEHTHEVVITLAEKKPQIIKVIAKGSFCALIQALEQMLGPDRDYTLPAMLIKVRKVEKK